jgi:hypothetical protein
VTTDSVPAISGWRMRDPVTMIVPSSLAAWAAAANGKQTTSKTARQMPTRNFSTAK